MKLYVARHGQTLWNLSGRVNGITDTVLTENGIMQAEQLAEKMKEKNIDIIVSSPLKRALDTAEIISKKCQTEVITDSRLTEQNYGIFEGMSSKNPEFLENKKCFAHKYPGGESMMQVAARTYALIEEMKDAYKDKTVLFVCHGGVCRVIATYFRDMTNEEFFLYKMENCGIEEYEA